MAWVVISSDGYPLDTAQTGDATVSDSTAEGSAQTRDFSGERFPASTPWSMGSGRNAWVDECEGRFADPWM